jgi:hypothetical protein
MDQGRWHRKLEASSTDDELGFGLQQQQAMDENLCQVFRMSDQKGIAQVQQN